jgi:uncharacterized protein
MEARLSADEWEVETAGGTTRLLLDEAVAGEQADTLFVCAHGAGGNRSDRAMNAVARTFNSTGVDLVRFNFLYKERGSGRPDPMPVLEATVSAVVERVRAERAPRRLIIGGRSMGGRACSMLAAKGFDADGLLLLAYPLHPAGQPEKLRDAHLPDIRMPTLCINGTRDELCRRELMERALETVTAEWTMHWLDGADHSFHVLKSSGRTDAQVMEEVGAVSAAWLAGID